MNAVFGIKAEETLSVIAPGVAIRMNEGPIATLVFFKCYNKQEPVPVMSRSIPCAIGVALPLLSMRNCSEAPSCRKMLPWESNMSFLQMSLILALCALFSVVKNDSLNITKDDFVDTCFEVPNTICLTTNHIEMPKSVPQPLVAYWYEVHVD